MKKKFAALLTAGLIALTSFTAADAATRDEIAAIQVKRPADFKYWTKDSAAQKQLVEYVRDVTNRRSKNFIPAEDRIVVFDWDGTLAGETAPCYFEWMMYVQRALHDDNFTAAPEDREFAQQVEDAINGDFKDRAPTLKFLGSDFGTREAMSQENVFAGMTFDEYEAYVKNFMDQPVGLLTNLKRGEAFYLPMVEVVKYLQANDFKVYIVSGTDRQLLRITTSDLLKIDSGNFIGTDARFLTRNQGDTENLKYTYKRGDQLIRGKFVHKDLQMVKVDLIAREIGKQPVLAFGNSGSDTSMLNYTIDGNKYRAMSFFVLCDDVNREYGNISRAEKSRKLAETNGWTTISMRDDFKTIYGDNVRRTE